MSRLQALVGRAATGGKTLLGPHLAKRQPRRVDLPRERWGLRVGPNGTLWLGETDLAELATTHGSTVYVIRGDAVATAAANAVGPAGAGHADIFFSYKTNPVPSVLRCLHAAGVGAEVSSPFELWLAGRLGVPSDRTVYDGAGKTDEALTAAIEQGVLLLNANSAGEAARAALIAEQLGTTVALGLRATLPGMWAGQFGIASGAPLHDAIRVAQRSSSVALRALHVHSGGTVRDHLQFHAHLDRILAACDAARAATGWHPTILDIGGSLPCPTVTALPTKEFRLNRALGTDLLPPDPAAAITLADAAATAPQVVAAHFRRIGIPAPRVIIEPGRSLTGDTMFLLTTVTEVKGDGADDATPTNAILHAGMNVAEPVRSEFHQLFSATAPAAAATVAYRLAGPLCTPADVLYNHWRLPRLAPGHVLAIMDAGAYFVPFSTSFSFPRPPIVWHDGAAVTTVRRAETFGDIVARDADFA